ncbi:hypothetical protein AQUCO_00300595v1 [Aquilegia coerulea]|uniref:LRAT domain-containing protein n=1 Tax=Aquilegia coerulea TaxID=218851 RepID=A0A2G5EZJ6_AQUCA|nr:hypothetical protein AQUCO_00300595v1 [Aquilegia coerulea]
MGLLSNKVDRSQLQPGDHIYSYRKAKSYAHHVKEVQIEIQFLLSTTLSKYRVLQVIHYTSTGGFGSYSSLSGKTRKKENQCENCGHDPNLKQGVIKTCIDCFLSGHDLNRFEYGVSFAHFCFKLPGTCTTNQSEPVDIVISRATELLNNQGFGEYDLFENNCECFAIFCKTYKHVSQQAYSKGCYYKLFAMEWRSAFCHD